MAIEGALTITMNDFSLSPAPYAWPLWLKYRAPLLGKGFVAIVEFHGRVLARPTDDSIWIDGVNPGGFALPAANIRTASLELGKTITGILVDIAEEAASFDEFQANVEEFFNDTDAESAGEWEACVEEVRRGNISSPGILPVFPAGSEIFIRVTQKPTEAVTPKDNSGSSPVLASVA
jgi:hypothetical protein